MPLGRILWRYHYPHVLPKATADASTKSQEYKPFRFDLV
jgi:hypothetical protein